MPFKVSARTILHLGGELISSDGIAFNELIKNAFDANSRNVEISVNMGLDFEIVESAWLELEKLDSDEPEDVDAADDDDDENSLEELVGELVGSIISDCGNASEIEEKLLESKDTDDVRAVLEEANYITFTDSGHGMSAKDLSDVYLTVGTPVRLKQRQNKNKTKARAILGEKGIGRLSAMRLGQKLRVTSSTKGESNWNVLEIDWRDFEDLDQELGDVQVSPRKGSRKPNRQTSGTTIRVSLLNSSWSQERLESIGKTELSKLTDPFQARSKFPIKLLFNGRKTHTERIEKIILEHAHAKVVATFDVAGANGPRLRGQVDYFKSPARKTKLRNKSFPFELNIDDLVAVTEKPSEQIVNVGPFTMECYWFNRRILTSIDAIGDRQEVLDLVKRWSGGLMLFRDGFRVAPYGGGDDDWLDLDRKALASQGYKVNRAQLIGKVDISIDGNPKLRDQTNREGLRDCSEKAALIQMLKYILEGRLRYHLIEVDKELKGIDPISFDTLGERLEREEEAINQGLDELRRISNEYEDMGVGEVEKSIRAAFRALKTVFNEAHSLADAAEDEKSRVFHLAGIGMLVETLAHELNRATRHAIDAIVKFGKRQNEDLLENAKLQLDNLQKRLSVLDPLSTSRRRRKQWFDVVDLIETILDSHEAEFERNNIAVEFICKPKSQEQLKIHFVKGMFVQILENLIDNSVFWLTRKQKKNVVGKRNIKKRLIRVELDCPRKLLRFLDSGPGIAWENREEVFKPFFSLKPAGQGKGLGLYISREIAEYHKASLYLLEEESSQSGRLNTFELDFSNQEE